MVDFFEKAGTYDQNGKYSEKIEDSEGLELYLKAVYNVSEHIYGLRLYGRTGKEIGSRQNRKERYGNLIKELDGIWQRGRLWAENDDVRDLEKLYCLVKGNLLLRQGQCEDEMFEDSSESYRGAVALLKKQIKQEGQWDSVDLLIQMSLGKYFRNLGRCAKRRNYYIAIYEMEKVREWIRKDTGEFNREKAHIWLDVAVNIGRANKKLYQLDKAKRYMWEVVCGIGAKAGDDAEEVLRRIERLEIRKDICKSGENISEEDMELYQEIKWPTLCRAYLIQALVQLAIVYRKERKYDKTEALCEAVRFMDPKNMDAANNLGACYRKKGEYEKAKKQFEPLIKAGNRFAEINFWKCILKEIEISQETNSRTESEFNCFVEKRGKDREIQMLKGRFLYQKKKIDEAFAVFKNLYEGSPYINEGTLGLKAYYNMAKCLMEQEKYQQAEKMLQEILKIHEEDRLAGIDLGWCMMKMNRYVSARRQYEKILGIDPEMDAEKLQHWDVPEDWLKFEKMKVRNNLGECYLRTREIEKAQIMFQKVCAEEEDNLEAVGFLAQCEMLAGEEARNQGDYAAARRLYESAVERLETIRKSREQDVQIISRLILAKGTRLHIIAQEKGKEEDEYREKAKEYREFIEHCLLYSPDICYMQKACCEIARFLKELKEDSNMDTLYRIFSYIRLWEREEGSQAFSHFMESQEFSCMGASEQGRILMYLFLIYGDVTRIKEECRYSPDAACEEIKIPRHYTSLNTLKILLKDSKPKEGEQPKEETARLRLWNSVYMNDPNEGVAFLDILLNWQEKAEQRILSQYFPHLSSNKGKLDPANGNVYITSLTNGEDDLLMWMTYADRAQGCNIVFADDFFDIRSKLNGSMGFPVYSDEDYPLYEVQYIDAERAKAGEVRIGGAEDAEKSSEAQAKANRIEDSMRDLWENIQALEEHLETELMIKKSGVDAIRGFIADALNGIRFLFKYAEFGKEQEMRLVRYSYKPKFEEKFEVPRMYVEVDREIRIKEVMLGPKMSQETTDEIVAWLYSTEKVEKVTKSAIHFR